MATVAQSSWINSLQLRGACVEAIEFAKSFDTFSEAWQSCERGDWMLWWIGRQKTTDRKRLVRIACQCARLALPHVRDGELRPLRAIETAERWASGDESVTLSDVRAAAVAVYAAAYAVYAASAAYAAVAADAAAYAVYAVYAAAYAAYAASAASAAEAREKTLKTCADIVRAEYPEPPL